MKPALRSLLPLGLFISLGTAALAQTELTVTLVPSNYNGANISCFGKKNGAIDLSVSGGMPPYTFSWSTGAETEDVTRLSGLYLILVESPSVHHTQRVVIN